MNTTPRILLVDDSRLTLEMETTFFQTHGFQVLATNEGARALALANSADLAILDMVLPDGSGADICVELRQGPGTRHQPVILLSATDSEIMREAAREAGADRFVLKSAGRQHLLDVVCELLKIPRRQGPRIKVVFTVQTMGGARETLGKAVDLSIGGLCLEVNREYPVGEELSLRFRLPGDREEIRASGRVCWSRERPEETWAIGVQFDDVSDSDHARLSNYIAASLDPAGTAA